MLPNTKKIYDYNTYGYGALEASQGHRSLVVGYIKVLGATKEQNWRQQKFSVTLKIRRNLSYVYIAFGVSYEKCSNYLFSVNFKIVRDSHVILRAYLSAPAQTQHKWRYFDMSYGVVGLPSPLYSNGLLPSTNKQVNVHPEKNDLYKNPWPVYCLHL